jgi:hypothetical protein
VSCANRFSQVLVQKQLRIFVAVLRLISIPKCEVMHEQVLKDSSLWGMEDRAEPPEDWLAMAIRKALFAWIDSAEPAPHIWTRIRQQVEPPTPSAD